jgi:hypothetical protein
MNTRTFTTFRHRAGALALALACSTLGVGCFSDSGNGPDDDEMTAIQGRVQGDIEVSGSGSVSGSGWEGTVVTTHEISANGTLGAAQDSVTASADGSFLLETSRTGHREWILRARRGGEEWMARFEGTLEANGTGHARPLNLESTLEAAAFLELKKTDEGRQVGSSEVNLAVDADVAASSRSAYRGSASARAALVAQLAASINEASRARAAFLAEADAQYQSRRAQIDSARVRAEAEFNASLYAAAGDTAQQNGAERAYLAAVLNAYVAANVERTECARAAEASYHAMIRASAQLSDSARTAMARNYARLLVIASDTAMRGEFRAAGASQARLQLVIDAGGRFRASVDTSGTRARIDSAVVRFRADVRAAFTSTADTGFSVFTQVTSQVIVNAMLDSLSTSIQSSIGSSTEGDDVGEAYAEAHTEAQADLQVRFQAVNNDAEEAEAAANLLAFLSVKSSHN